MIVALPGLFSYLFFKLLSKHCAFGDYENEMVRESIVFGVTSVKIREKLTNEGDKLTLDIVIQIAQSYEYAQEQLKTMAVPTEVYYIKGKRKVQGVPQSQTAALPRPQEEEETDKSNQAQTEQTYEKH